MLLNAKTKRGDAVKQPEGLNDKPLVFKEEVTLTGHVQGNCPAGLLLRVQGAVSRHLGEVTKQVNDQTLI